MNGGMRKRIAWNIRYFRVKLGLSQIQLAADSNIDTSYISRLERGLENPTIRTLDRIAKALGVSTVFVGVRGLAGADDVLALAGLND